MAELHRKSSWKRRLVLVGAVGLVGSLGFATTSPAAPGGTSKFRSMNGSCGKVVVDPKQEHPTFVLQNDIGPCSSDGLIFKASNVTIDLNGHSITGTPLVPDGPDPGTVPDGGFGEGVGIRLVGNSNVTITNSKFPSELSTISDFDAGVVIQRGARAPARGNVVSNIRLFRNVGAQESLGGPECPSSDEETVCEVSDFNDGLALIGAEGTTVGPNNTVEVNGSGGIRLDDGAVGNTITANTVQDNVGNGVRFMSLTSGNRVTGNTIRRNAGGVNLSFENPDNVVEHNTITDNRALGVATGYHSEGTVVHDNLISGNRSGGITLASGENSITDNHILNNGRGTGAGRGNGIQVGSGTDNFPRVGTTVSGNHVHGSGGNGIRITCMGDQDPINFAGYGCLVWDTHNSVLNNTATGNAVNGPSGTLTISGQVTGWFDLLDSTNTLSNQSPFDPSGHPLTNCGTNIWSGNTFTTAFPACTTG